MRITLDHLAAIVDRLRHKTRDSVYIAAAMIPGSRTDIRLLEFIGTSDIGYQIDDSWPPDWNSYGFPGPPHSMQHSLACVISDIERRLRAPPTPSITRATVQYDAWVTNEWLTDRNFSTYRWVQDPTDD